MAQAVIYYIFLRANDTCLFCQHEDINKIANQLNEDFCSIGDWFLNEKLTINFGEDKAKLTFIPNAPFLYLLKKWENYKVFCFQKVGKGWIGYRWVRRNI